jgi:hypothetical protein
MEVRLLKSYMSIESFVWSRCIFEILTEGWAFWHTSVIPATRETDAGRSKSEARLSKVRQDSI